MCVPSQQEHGDLEEPEDLKVSLGGGGVTCDCPGKAASYDNSSSVNWHLVFAQLQFKWLACHKSDAVESAAASQQ